MAEERPSADHATTGHEEDTALLRGLRPPMPRSDRRRDRPFTS
jgi:hypothetical protein